MHWDQSSLWHVRHSLLSSMSVRFHAGASTCQKLVAEVDCLQRGEVAQLLYHTANGLLLAPVAAKVSVERTRHVSGAQETVQAPDTESKL